MNPCRVEGCLERGTDTVVMHGDTICCVCPYHLSVIQRGTHWRVRRTAGGEPVLSPIETLVQV